MMFCSEVVNSFILSLFAARFIKPRRINSLSDALGSNAFTSATLSASSSVCARLALRQSLRADITSFTALSIPSFPATMSLPEILLI